MFIYLFICIYIYTQFGEPPALLLRGLPLRPLLRELPPQRLQLLVLIIIIIIIIMITVAVVVAAAVVEVVVV